MTAVNLSTQLSNSVHDFFNKFNYTELNHNNLNLLINNLLTHGCKHRDNYFHVPSLVTVSNNLPQARVIVLRDHDDLFQLQFNTDKRSSKVQALSGNDNGILLFYDVDLQLQMQFYGLLSIIKDASYLEHRYNNMRNLSQVCYRQNLAPGTLIQNHSELNYNSEGINNFTSIALNVNKIELLYLNSNINIRLKTNIDNLNQIIEPWQLLAP